MNCINFLVDNNYKIMCRKLMFYLTRIIFTEEFATLSKLILYLMISNFDLVNLKQDCYFHIELRDIHLTISFQI